MSGKRIEIGNAGQLVGRQVAMLRIVQGLTQDDLSDALSARGRAINVPGIRAIENGRRRVDIDDLFALASAFGVEPGDLIRPLKVRIEQEDA